MNLFDPRQWADVHGYLVLATVTGISVVWCIWKMTFIPWKDWVDERWGRGSVRDWWFLDHMERESLIKRNELGAVIEARRQGLSWDRIAQFLGRSTASVREKYRDRTK
jgi:hypothetical protein